MQNFGFNSFILSKSLKNHGFNIVSFGGRDLIQTEHQIFSYFIYYIVIDNFSGRQAS